MTQHNYSRAALFSLTAFALWSVGDALLKWARTADMPEGQVLVVSGLSGMAVILLLAILGKKLHRLRPQSPKRLLLIGLCQALAYLLWIVALPHLLLVGMYTVSFLTPMTVAAMASLFLKEELGAKRAAAIGTGFAGVVVAVDPASLIHDTAAWLPHLAVFGSMLMTATQMLLLRVVSQKESGGSLAFYPRAMIVAMGLLLCLLHGWGSFKPLAALAIAASGAIGAVGWVLLAKAYKSAPAAAVAPFQYGQIFVGALLGYMIWDNLPGAWMLSGAAIIIASGIWLVRHERRMSRTMIRVD
ncbi:MAG: DMT family transporter [Alphaproteobacteria bacterium]|nr:DMT family transporter [Alphaproteobacteria bacterium]